MAFLFTKRVGAPAGAINITIAATTYLIDDVSNTIISETDPSKAAGLALHPYLLANGGTGTPYVAPRVGIAQELDYSQSVTALSCINTTAITSTFAPAINFTVASRPVMVEAYCPLITVNGSTVTVNFGFYDALTGTIKALSTIDPGTLNGGGAAYAFKRITTPGVYSYKMYAYGSSATGFVAQAGTGEGLTFSPMFITAVER